jgi:hypothetical protein
MRLLIGLCMTLSACACSSQTVVQSVDKIELRASGLDVSIGRGGAGDFVSSQRVGHRQSGTLDVGLSGFARLLNELSPYQRQSGPTAETSRRFMASNCPGRLPYITDNGIASVRWIGPSLDQIFIVDLGCDYKRHAERNQKLRGILSSLPVPKPSPLP